MPPTRRLVYVAAFLFVTLIYFRMKPGTPNSGTAFYSRTGSGYRQASSLDNIEPVRGSSNTKKLNTEDAKAEAMSGRLREAETVAKENANKKAPSREAVMDGVNEENSEEHKYHAGIQELVTKDPKNPNIAGVPVPPQPTQNRSLRQKSEEGVKVKTPQEQEEEDAVEDILNDYLRMAPILIFSKSYCPYSAKAKRILTEIYQIEPPPYIVELDKVEMGMSIQHLLAETTKRSTVPNVMVRGRSIGGGDDIQALHEQGQLEAKIREYGGSQVMKITIKKENKI